MAVKFGKILFGKDFLKFNTKPTEITIETWVQNGLSVFSSAIMEFFAASCACCYLKDAHHSARSFLRAQTLKDKSILCESDKDILKNIDDAELKNIFEKLIKFRKNLDSFPFDLARKRSFRLRRKAGLFVRMKMYRMKRISGKSAEPLLLLEKLAHKMIFLFYGKRMCKLSETIEKISQPFDHIHSIFLTTKEEGKERYYVSIADKGDKMKFLEFPLYKD